MRAEISQRRSRDFFWIRSFCFQNLTTLLLKLPRFLFLRFYKIARNPKLENPIVIVGNPRSGTTFLHRYLINSGIGSGSELWQLIYPSLVLQKIIKPLLPILEKISPARHHSTVCLLYTSPSPRD